MSKYKRIFVVVVDSLGIGEMTDAANYGDSGADTLGHIVEHEGTNMPNLHILGIANLKELKGLAPVENPI